MDVNNGIKIGKLWYICIYMYKLKHCLLVTGLHWFFFGHNNSEKYTTYLAWRQIIIIILLIGVVVNIDQYWPKWKVVSFNFIK